ncbi:hypothetical protein NP233_g12951 [Leucocoprinus birnbaumii]|uniref:Uncharacterized protein n=1 Tax=Leucocoprinus birnbaumii TaxID=56174 RepID=A0AAD5VFI7_9AGAR|nr:hypothetical protein NP233_g12951 [Leucocoprinus birnbaumii]
MRETDNFSTLCVVRADLSPLASSAEPKAGKSNKTYWTIVFSVEIQFGLTEFKARIKWVDNGMTKYGPASIIYNERGHRADEDEPDVFPEDEANTLPMHNGTPTNGIPPRSANRSEPVSRARTPIAQHASIPPSAASSRRPSTSSRARSEFSDLSYASAVPPPAVVPEVARVPDLSRDMGVVGGHHTPWWLGVGETDRCRGIRRRLRTEGMRATEGRNVSGSSRSREKERERDTPRATPRSTKIGETLSAVWVCMLRLLLGVADPPPPAVGGGAGGSTTRGSSIKGHSPPHSTRSHHTSQHKSPYVETISATIENPKGAPWDTLSRSLSHTSGHHSLASPSIPGSVSGGPGGGAAEKERMSSLWDDAPRSAYGDPPQTPWGKTPANVARALGDEDGTTVLLASATPPSVPGELAPLSRSLSLSGKSPHGSHAGVPMDDVDDLPPPSGMEVTGGPEWGGMTPRSIHATPSVHAGGSSIPGTPGAIGAPPPADDGSKIPRRSRKNSVAGSALSSAKVASPVRSVMDAFGGEGEQQPGMIGSPNLLAGVPGIGGHGHQSVQGSPGKRSPLNPAIHEPAPADAWGFDNPPPATASHHGTPGPEILSREIIPSTHHSPAPPAPPPIDTQLDPAESTALTKTPKSTGSKTPKSTGSKNA